jgi:hypothetical protein
MHFKQLIGKASDLAKDHSGKLGPLGKKAAGLLGTTDRDSKKARKAKTRRRRSPSHDKPGPAVDRHRPPGAHGQDR